MTSFPGPISSEQATFSTPNASTKPGFLQTLSQKIMSLHLIPNNIYNITTHDELPDVPESTPTSLSSTTPPATMAPQALKTTALPSSQTMPAATPATMAPQALKTTALPSSQTIPATSPATMAPQSLNTTALPSSQTMQARELPRPSKLGMFRHVGQSVEQRPTSQASIDDASLASSTAKSASQNLSPSSSNGTLSSSTKLADSPLLPEATSGGNSSLDSSPLSAEPQTLSSTSSVGTLSSLTKLADSSPAPEATSCANPSFDSATSSQSLQDPQSFEVYGNSIEKTGKTTSESLPKMGSDDRSISSRIWSYFSASRVEDPSLAPKGILVNDRLIPEPTYTTRFINGEWVCARNKSSSASSIWNPSAGENKTNLAESPPTISQSLSELTSDHRSISDRIRDWFSISSSDSINDSFSPEDACWAPDSSKVNHLSIPGPTPPTGPTNPPWNASVGDNNWILGNLTIKTPSPDNTRWLLPPSSNVLQKVETPPGRGKSPEPWIGISGWIARKSGECTRQVFIGSIKMGFNMMWHGVAGLVPPSWVAAKHKVTRVVQTIPPGYRIPAAACTALAMLGIYASLRSAAPTSKKNGSAEKEPIATPSLLDRQFNLLQQQFERERKGYEKQLGLYERQIDELRERKAENPIKAKESEETRHVQMPSTLTINFHKHKAPTQPAEVKSQTFDFTDRKEASQLLNDNQPLIKTK